MALGTCGRLILSYWIWGDGAFVHIKYGYFDSGAQLVRGDRWTTRLLALTI
jgi:hypothetical protein